MLTTFSGTVGGQVRQVLLYIHHQELATILLNYHIGRNVLGSMCVGVWMWLGWSGIRVAGFSLQHQCGNSTE